MRSFHPYPPQFRRHIQLRISQESVILQQIISFLADFCCLPMLTLEANIKVDDLRQTEDKFQHDSAHSKQFSCESNISALHIESREQNVSRGSSISVNKSDEDNFQ